VTAVTYRYRAATASGEVVEGVVQAATPGAAIDALRRQTLVPVSVEPAGAAAGAARSRWQWIPASRHDDALAAATRTLATMLAAGSPLDRALDFAARHATTEPLRLALDGVLADVRRGESLAASLGARPQAFGTLAPALVRAGETSGTLDDALAQLADHVERTRDLRAQLRAALWYPALMGIVAGVGVTILLAFVVPRFAEMLDGTGGTLPASTRMLVALSGAVTQGWWIALLLAAAAAAGGRAWLQDAGNRARWHALRLQLPVAGRVERTIATARFSRALGTLLRSGAGVVTALRIARESVTNLAMSAGIERAIGLVERGEPVASSLASVLPPLAAQLLAVGEETGALDTMALRIADTSDAEAQRSLRSLVSLVEPLLIVCFGGVVGFVALAMLQAVYSINVTTL
jgi:type II secretory pathway component PulF